METNHKYCDFNASLMCGVMEEKYNLQCPKLQIHNAGSNNVSIFNTSQNVQDVHHYIVNPIYGNFQNRQPVT